MEPVARLTADSGNGDPRGCDTRGCDARGATTPPAPEPLVTRPATREGLRLFVLLTLTMLLVGLCVMLSVPFLPALTWAIALAILAWPLHAWIRHHVAWPTAAALLSALAVLLLILVPGLFVTYQLAQELGSASERMREASAKQVLRDKITEVPALAEVEAWLERAGVDLENEFNKTVTEYTQGAAGLLQGSVSALLQIVVAFFVLFHLFRDRELLRETRSLLPLSRAESEFVFARAAESVHANLYATLITGLISAIGGGTMFWILGLPSPVLWGVVMFVLSVLPMVGTAFIWGPAAAFLIFTQQWPAAIALIGWGLASGILVDNILYVRLVGNRMRMHEVPALIAFLGGLAVFGASGMILGPAILAVTAALLEVWKMRTVGPDVVVASGG